MPHSSGFTFQHPYPPGVQCTPGFGNPGPWSSSDSDHNSNSESSAIAQHTLEEDSIDPAELDHIIALFDSKEYQAYQEIQKLALRVEKIEKKDKILGKLLGWCFVNLNCL